METFTRKHESTDEISVLNEILKHNRTRVERKERKREKKMHPSSDALGIHENESRD